MGNPTRKTPNREEDGKHLHRNPNGAIDHTRVEVDIGIQLVLDKVVVFEGNLFQLLSDLKKGIFQRLFGQQFVAGRLDDRRAGIKVLVDPVTKAH